MTPWYGIQYKVKVTSIASYFYDTYSHELLLVQKRPTFFSRFLLISTLTSPHQKADSPLFNSKNLELNEADEYNLGNGVE